LAGALLGASAGAETPQSGWAGAARGAGAAVKGAQEQDQRAQQQAQQQFQNQQEVSKQDQEKNLVDAQVAHMTAATVTAQHQNDLGDKEYHDKHNAAAQAMVNTLTEAGGVPPVDGALPESLPATDLMEAYKKGIQSGKNIRQAPDGYVRHFFDKTDSSELTWDDKAGNWVQADGTPANMTDKTMVTVLDVPREAMKVKRPISGKYINAARGINLVDPDKTYQMSPLDMDGLNTHRLSDANEQARTNAANRQVRAQETANQREADRQRQAEYTDMYNQVKEANVTLQARQKEMMDQSSPDYKSISSQIDANNQRLLDKYNEVHPSKTPIKSAVALPAPPGDEKSPVQTLTDQTLKDTDPLIRPLVDVSINGGGEAKLSPADDLNSAIDNLKKLRATGRVSTKAYRSSLDRLSNHYQKLPAAEKQFKDQTYSQSEGDMKAELKAKHPDYTSAQLEDLYQMMIEPTPNVM
jgi:hypothetical protein